MNNKAFFIYQLSAGIIFIVLAIYIIAFDQRIKAVLGDTKTYVFSCLMIAYGIFRIWRSIKMRNS